MMKKNIFIGMMSLIGITIPAISATAQNNDGKKEILSLPEKPAQQTDGTFKPKLLPDSTTSFPMLPVEVSATDMFLLPDANMVRYNPLMWNYNLSDTTKFLPRFSYIPFSQQTTYIGLGEYNNVGASLLWKPTGSIFEQVVNSSDFESDDYGAFDWTLGKNVQISVPELMINDTIRWSNTRYVYKEGVATTPYIKDILNGDKILMQHTLQYI